MLEPVLVLAGPTAVGKTALSLPTAQALGAEIVNVDSRQLYRYMDVGTAKPTPAQRAQVPHHLLDLLVPTHTSSAAHFAVAAQQALRDIQQRGKRVLLVAGSGLYLRAILYGLMPTPPAWPPLRHILSAYAQRHGTAALHRRLQEVDPEAAAFYHPQDRVRLVRALEITYLTGEPCSLHQRRDQHRPCLVPYVGVILTRQREELYARIGARTEAMLAAGWLEEVRTLMAQGYTTACPAMNSLGYRELCAYLAGQASWDATVAQIQQATRRFAKRQLTWFQHLAHATWLNLSGMDEEAAVVEIIQRLRTRPV